MIELRLHVTKERAKELDWDDWCTLEAFLSGDQEAYSMRDLRQLVARYMRNEQGTYLEERAALKILGRLKNEQIGEAAKQLADALIENVVPKENGSGSK